MNISVPTTKKLYSQVYSQEKCLFMNTRTYGVHWMLSGGKKITKIKTWQMANSKVIDKSFVEY